MVKFGPAETITGARPASPPMVLSPFVKGSRANGGLFAAGTGKCRFGRRSLFVLGYQSVRRPWPTVLSRTLDVTWFPGRAQPAQSITGAPA